MAYKSFAAGYLVKDNKVLLVHHNKFNKWVPPGGHIEENETPAEAVVREFLEEVGLPVKVIPAFTNGFKEDLNCTPMPFPFHIGLYREGFDTPRMGYFFYVAADNEELQIKLQTSELSEIGWFGKDELENLPTFDQVRIEARYVLDNYPKSE